MTTASPTVIILGSLHYDIMMDAPDRPRKGETVTGRSWCPKCGGKGGNQAVAAARQGARTHAHSDIADFTYFLPIARHRNLRRAGLELGVRSRCL